MERIPRVITTVVLVGVLAVVGGLGIMASSPQQVAADTFEIPWGAIIDSATFGIYSSGAGGQTVNLHRITADWTEAGVTWDNFGGHDASVVSSFSANSDGWNTADVTDLVRDWVDGTHPNFGLLLEQGLTSLTGYRSSDYAIVADRPWLEICYHIGAGDQTCVTIQRGAFGDVTDACIEQEFPTTNYGSSTSLYTGQLSAGNERQSVVRFDFAASQVLPAQPPSVPAVSQSGMIGAAALMAALLVWYMRRRWTVNTGRIEAD